MVGGHERTFNPAGSWFDHNSSGSSFGTWLEDCPRHSISSIQIHGESVLYKISLLFDPTLLGGDQLPPARLGEVRLVRIKRIGRIGRGERCWKMLEYCPVNSIINAKPPILTILTVCICKICFLFDPSLLGGHQLPAARLGEVGLGGSGASKGSGGLGE